MWPFKTIGNQKIGTADRRSAVRTPFRASERQSRAGSPKDLPSQRSFFPTVPKGGFSLPFTLSGHKKRLSGAWLYPIKSTPLKKSIKSAWPGAWLYPIKLTPLKKSIKSAWPGVALSDQIDPFKKEYKSACRARGFISYLRISLGAAPRLTPPIFSKAALFSVLSKSRASICRFI